MSNPEISRRCAACGATIRQRAAFCPQCGNAVEEKGAFDPSVTQPLTPIPPKKPVAPTASKVGKLKKVSSVVLDQAAYDPSVRFLLIAAGLFGLFIILLVLSKVLG